MPNVTYTIIPNLGRRPLTLSREQKQAEIDQLRAAFAVSLIKSHAFDGEAIANDLDWLENYGMPAKLVSDGRVKTWIFPQSFEAVQVSHTDNGQWATEPNTHDSIEGFQWLPRDVSDFYKQYRQHFPQVPKFITQGFSQAEAERLQFGNGPGIDFPLGKILRNDPLVNFKTTMPQGIAYVVQGGELAWFKTAEYRAAYPLPLSAPTQPTGPTLPDSTIVAGVRMIITDSSTTDTEKVQSFKQIVGKAR
jgi:hypothetical protein